jgi:hypothetical protein
MNLLFLTIFSRQFLVGRGSCRAECSMSICKSVVKFGAVPPCQAAPSVTLDQGHRLSRTPLSFLRAARVFLSGLVDDCPFQEVSLRREASILFTGNGPLVYRWPPIDLTESRTEPGEMQA